MKENTKNLIQKLVDQLKPVKVVKYSLVDFIKVVMVGLLSVLAAVLILGLRKDFNQQLLSTRFIAENLLLLVLGLAAIYSALSLSIPSIDDKSKMTLFFTITTFLVLIIFSILTETNPFVYLGHGFSCVSEILAISVLPAAILFFIIRRAASLKRDLIGFCVLVCGISFGLFGAQLTCADSTPLHIIIWHIFPSILIMVAGVFIAKIILKKV